LSSHSTSAAGGTVGRGLMTTKLDGDDKEIIELGANYCSDLKV